MYEERTSPTRTGLGAKPTAAPPWRGAAGPPATQRERDGEAPRGPAWWDFTTGAPERDRENMRLLLESVQDLYVALDPLDRLRHAVDRVLHLTGAERGILLQERAGVLLPLVARRRDRTNLAADAPYCRGVVEKVRLGRTLHRLVATDADGPAQLGQSALGLRLMSIMVAPLEYEDRLLGILYLDATYQTRPEFTDPEERVFRTMAGLISACLEHERLRAQHLAQVRLDRQLQLARAVQERLLPRRLPEIPGYEVVRAARPRSTLSGDYHDVVPRPDGRTVVAVGDVCGSGIGQAMYAAMVRGQLHLLVRQGAPLPAILDELNRLLLDTMPGSSNMTLFLGEIDPAKRTLAHASAGHNPPLHVARDGRHHLLPPTGPLLGFTADVHYDLSAPRRVAPGDVVLLYTDGLTEARDAAGGIYGDERMVRVLTGLATSQPSAQGVLAGLLADLDAFRGPEEGADDLTLLVIRGVGAA